MFKKLAASALSSLPATTQLCVTRSVSRVSVFDSGDPVNYDVVVASRGIVGCASGRPMKSNKPELSVAILDKENHLGIYGSNATTSNERLAQSQICNFGADVSKSTIICPSSNMFIEKVYTFPTANNEPIRAPSTFIKELLEMFDPVLNKAPIEDPTDRVVTPMYAGPRLLQIRRHKMRKHKRLKRYKRDRFQYLKRHREEKARSERAFRKRMSEKLAELDTFDPENYIKDVIVRAKRDWKTELAPTGRKLYPHWSTLMSLEELYNLPESNYIDKKAGFPEEEDKERIRQMKIKYYKEFRGENIENSVGNTDVDGLKNKKSS